jgi:hypothetical protein
MPPATPLPLFSEGRSPVDRVRLPAIVLVLGVLIAAIAVWAPAAEQRSSSERSYSLTRGAQDMLTAMLDQETGLRGYILTGDRRFLEPYRAGRADVERAERALLRQAGGHDGLTAIVAQSSQIAMTWQQLAEGTAERVKRRERGRAWPPP